MNPYDLWESGSRDISCALYEPRRKSVLKGKARGEDDYLTPSIVHMPLCMCILLVQSDL